MHKKIHEEIVLEGPSPAQERRHPLSDHVSDAHRGPLLLICMAATDSTGLVRVRGGTSCLHRPSVDPLSEAFEDVFPTLSICLL